MKTTTVNDPFGIKANSISTVCAFYRSLDGDPISRVGLGLSHSQRAIERRGSSRLLDLLSLTTQVRFF